MFLVIIIRTERNNFYLMNQESKPNKKWIAIAIIVIVLIISTLFYIAAQLPIIAPTKPTPEPEVTNSPNGQINQVHLVVNCSEGWVGIYSQTSSSPPVISSWQNWSGSSSQAVTLIRPNGATPWIIATDTQGFWAHKLANITVSVIAFNGTVLKSASKSSIEGDSIYLYVDIDAPSKNVTINYNSGFVTVT
jgi:hypothetical protein